MKLVIPCAGKGTRLGLDTPKVLTPINGKTLLGHITFEWSGLVDSFVIVVSSENEQLIRQNSGRAEFVVQDPLKGIADAILQAESLVQGRFVVNLGDCLFRGKFDPTNFDLGVGVWRTINGEYRKSYSVQACKDIVTKVVEKPKSVMGYCGMGTYFFDNRVFGYIRETAPSSLRNEVEITDVIQNMIDAGEKITPVWFEGKYINVTYPEDIKRAEEILK